MYSGQLSLSIEVKAIKFDEDSVLSVIKPVSRPASREWVSVDDIRRRISVLSAESKLSSIHIDDEETKPSCFCVCFSNLFTRRKKKVSKSMAYLSNGGEHNNSRVSMHSQQSTSNNTHNNVNNSHVSMQQSTSHYISHTTTTHITTKPPHNNSHTSIDNLRTLLDMFHDKVDEIFTVLQDGGDGTRDGLIKYFEQTRGVLVLDTDTDGATFTVNTICTTVQQVEQLKRDYGSGQLGRDLEGQLTSDQLLQTTGVLGIKVKVSVKHDEIDLVEQELT